jgi:hypothetical protein
MRAYLFIFFIYPIVLFSQNPQAQPANGPTDCPTFGKKNSFSKAGLFQYMRTHKPQRVPDTREQQAIYRPSALPDLQQAQEQRDREMAIKNQTSKRSKKERNKPIVTEDPEEALPATKAIAQADPVDPIKEEPKTPVAADSRKEEIDQPVESDEDADSSVKERSASIENVADAAREKRAKKIKRAAFKAKVQHLFKRTNKPASRKNVQKCPTF